VQTLSSRHALQPHMYLFEAGAVINEQQELPRRTHDLLRLEAVGHDRDKFGL